MNRATRPMRMPTEPDVPLKSRGEVAKPSYAGLGDPLPTAHRRGPRCGRASRPRDAGADSRRAPEPSASPRPVRGRIKTASTRTGGQARAADSLQPNRDSRPHAGGATPADCLHPSRVAGRFHVRRWASGAPGSSRRGLKCPSAWVLTGERGTLSGLAPSLADPAQELRVQPLEVSLRLACHRAVVPKDIIDAEHPVRCPELLPCITFHAARFRGREGPMILQLLVQIACGVQSGAVRDGCPRDAEGIQELDMATERFVSPDVDQGHAGTAGRIATPFPPCSQGADLGR